MNKAIGPAPIGYFFLAVGAAFMSAMLLGFVGFSGIWALLGAIQPIAPTAQNIGYCAALALAVTFIVWVGLIFLGQAFCALILVGRSLTSTSDDSIGTMYASRRYAEWLPFATTPWSRFWIAVHSPSWRAALAVLAVVMVPAVSAFVPLQQNPVAVIVVAIVMLPVAVLCGRREAQYRVRRIRSEKRSEVELESRESSYRRGLEYRDRKRALTRARLKDAALTDTAHDGPSPTPFDRWVEAEVQDALREHPLAVPPIRAGDLSALDAPARLAFGRLGGRVPLERVREVMLARATRKRRSRTRPTS